MERIRVGMIGYGYWGPNLVRNFVENHNSEVVMVSDLKKERLAQFNSIYPSIKTTTDYCDLFTQELDAVVIATPPTTHFPLASEFLRRGYNVLVEKPLTLCAEHAEKLVELAKDVDRILMVGHTFEYNAAVIALKKLIDSGDLGEIYYIDAARLNLGLFSRDLNVLWDLAPHDISILLYLLGEMPISVTANGSSSINEGIHDVAYLNLRFPKNIMAHVHVSWLDPCKVRRVTVVGSKKMAVYNDLDSNEKIKVYDKGVISPEYTNTFGEFQFSYRSGDILIPYVRMTEPLKAEVQDFVDCIKNHTQPCSDGVDGLNVVRVLEAANRSLTNSGHVEYFK